MCHIGAMSKVSRAYFGAWYGLPQGICFISYFFFLLDGNNNHAGMGAQWHV
jgi:hypothetical protein